MLETISILSAKRADPIKIIEFEQKTALNIQAMVKFKITGINHRHIITWSG